MRKRLTRGRHSKAPLGSLVQDGSLDSCLGGAREWGDPLSEGEARQAGPQGGTVAFSCPHLTCSSCLEGPTEIEPPAAHGGLQLTLCS